MKFFTAIVMVALVALALGAEIPEAARSKLEAVKEVEPVDNSAVNQEAAARGKRGLVLSAYSAPLTAAVPVAAAAAPVAYTYSAGFPYAYSSVYSSPYYSYPAAAAYYL